ncbi:MAG: glycosyltransferase family 39 protein, partial [Anaerolinea sp.]|nr:glycosyltransferase family 39 protein [Anaerolinea sp.]
DEWLLIGLIAAALVVRWVVIAYWTFTAYDSLWVYGYEGRLYTLLGGIPSSIGYYPQFMPLQYTFAQLLFGIDDHAARAGLIFLHAGSILAAYVLGTRLFNRRTGLILAAIWALHPHLGEWSRAGDLEIPLATLFTLAATYFLLAWIKPDRRYALIAGVMLGIGMWIKPTMGAFVLGMALLVGIEVVRVRFDIRRILPRVQVAVIAGVAALPLGGVWYVRNVLLGHNPVDFPSGFWQTLAAQSGVEFGWLLLALIVVLAYLFTRRTRPPLLPTLISVALILAALLPTLIPYWALSLDDIFPAWTWLEPLITPARRLNPLEWTALLAGAAGLVFTLIRFARRLPPSIARIGWAAALALPYGVVWFFFYSYHYRLSFAIVPLLILPTAALLAFWIQPGRRAASLALILLLGIPGVVSAVYDPFGGWDYIQTDKYPDDDARYRSGNAALMNVVDGLNVWLADHPGETLTVSAPGVDRLPFFFPLQDIRTEDAPTRLNEIDGAEYFVYGLPETRGEYQGIPITENQVLGALSRADISRRAWGEDDGIFRYDIFELNLDQRWNRPDPAGKPAGDVVFGGVVRYLGYDVGGFDLWEGRRVINHFFWEVLAPTDRDLSLFIHLRDADGNLITTWDNPIARGELGYYSTQVWETGEFISDERVFRLPDGAAAQWVGEGYRCVIGWYDPLTNTRLPITVDGVPAGDELVVDDRFLILADGS